MVTTHLPPGPVRAGHEEHQVSYPPTEQGWSGRAEETVTLGKSDPAAGLGREQAGYPSSPQDEQQAPAPGGHGGPAAPGWPPPTNTKAIIALCTVFGTPVLGIVFGVMARREIDRTGEAGRAYATWGMGLGIASVAFWVLYFAAGIAFFLFAGLGLFTATSGLDGTGSGF